jgi:hypothetical protein
MKEEKSYKDEPSEEPNDPQDYWIDDEDAGFEDEPSEEAPDRSTSASDARLSVEGWEIRSVGHRPMDFMARDCLFGSLFRDYRVTWFRSYIKRPSPWMESLVGNIPSKADRDQALRYVVLHFLHKLHLSRMMDFVSQQEQQYAVAYSRFKNTLKRLWNCTPYGMEVSHANYPGKPRPGCNLSRLCPWCHARKVVQLHDVLLKGPLKSRKALYLFLGKSNPFPERMGGVDGSYQAVDLQDYTAGEVREYFGRYFARDRERLMHTRNVLVECLMTQANELELGNGMWTHQLGSVQLENGQRTFLHDISMIAEVDNATIDRMPKDEDGNIFWGGWQNTGLPDIDAALRVLWLPLPLDKPAALRVALAGSSIKYAVSKLELPQEWFGQEDGYRTGIPGALSWQPTISFDDQMWFAYADAVKNQQLYHPFGSWKKSMAKVATELRSSIDRKFQKTQAKRFGKDRQQKGNRKRSGVVQDRRAELLKVARELWPVVVAEPSSSRGRPGRRKRLAEMLRERSHTFSQRDIDWLMTRLPSLQDS